MTNLVAIALTLAATHTTELKTNVLEYSWDPTRIAVATNNYSVWVGVRDGYATPYTTPQDKWVKTLVIQEDNLSFRWMGEHKTVTCSQVVSSNIVHLRIKQQWEIVK